MLKKNDFVDIEYTGKTGEEDFVFDTTNEQLAKDNNIHNPRMKYGALTVCLGQGQLIPGLDKALEGKETGKEYTITVEPEDAFGKKDPKMIQLISTSKFKKANINPQPGLQVNVDNQTGIIKSVSGGRTIVDFNHPLSGKPVTYDIKVGNLVTDLTKKVSILAGAMLQIEEPTTVVTGDKAEVTLAFEMPKEASEVISKKVIEVLPEIKEITFKNKNQKPEAKPASKPATPSEQAKE